MSADSHSVETPNGGGDLARLSSVTAQPRKKADRGDGIEIPEHGGDQQDRAGGTHPAITSTARSDRCRMRNPACRAEHDREDEAEHDRDDEQVQFVQ